MLTTVGRIIYNDRIERALQEALGDAFDPDSYEFVNRSMKKRDTTVVHRRPRAELRRSDDRRRCSTRSRTSGFHYATQAGITISKNDVVVPPNKAEILGRYEGEVSEIQDQYDTGLITEEERNEAVVEHWTAATDEVGDGDGGQPRRA